MGRPSGMRGLRGILTSRHDAQCWEQPIPARIGDTPWHALIDNLQTKSPMDEPAGPIRSKARRNLCTTAWKCTLEESVHRIWNRSTQSTQHPKQTGPSFRTMVNTLQVLCSVVAPHTAPNLEDMSSLCALAFLRCHPPP